jgi:hypothetical protein
LVGSGIRVLSIRTRHIVSLAGLPDLYRDPFDAFWSRKLWPKA